MPLEATYLLIINEQWELVGSVVKYVELPIRKGSLSPNPNLQYILFIDWLMHCFDKKIIL